MHEFSVCNALIREASQQAAQRRARAIRSIRLTIGPLSGIDCEALRHAYPLAAAGTACAGAALVIDAVPVRVRCRDCSATGDAVPQRLACSACGSIRTTLIGGDEMLLSALELLMEDG